MQSDRGASRSVVLSGELIARLRELSRAEGVTLFMTLLAAFQTLLMRYTGQEDIVVGTPVAGRNQVEIEGLIGFFINTLALRTDLRADPSFRQVLSRVRDVVLAAHAHQALPFEKLVEELEPERRLSHAPLVQVMFDMWSAAAGQGTSGTPASNGRSPVTEDLTAKFDLSLFLVEVGESVMGRLEYNTDLFDGSRMGRMEDFRDQHLRPVDVVRVFGSAFGLVGTIDALYSFSNVLRLF